MENLKKIGYFFLVAFAVMGVLGGIGYSIFGGSWPIAIGVAVAGYAAWPRIKEWAQKLTA